MADIQNPAYPPTPQPYAIHDPDEINLLEYLLAILKARWFIIACVVAGLVMGYSFALYKGPSFESYAVIAPKESESSAPTPNFSGLGMLGGIVANQLSMGGNASLEKIETILDSKKFNAEMIEAKNLLPFIYKDQWDTVTKNWKEDFVLPKMLKVGGAVAGGHLEKEIASNGTMTITITAKDSTFADTLISSYLTFLDDYIRTSVQQKARENRDYLEEQLITISDPLLRAKIQELIAKEVEKMMVVSQEAFTIIDPPVRSLSFKEKKLYPLVFAFGLGFMALLWTVLAHAFVSGEKTEEDKKLIEDIKSEISKMPWKK